MRNNALGRGLSSLLKEEIVPIESIKNTNLLHISELEAGKFQPRKNFNEEKIRELADSIISKGLVQPIVVNKAKAGKYEIIAGERRYRACKLAGIFEIPVIIKDFREKDVLEIALIENIQREGLTAIEEAEGFERLIKEFGYSQADLAASVGKSRSHVANLLRLNQLPSSIKNMVNTGQLSMGHARCLIGIDNAEELANKIVDKGLNVRQAEDLAQKKNRKYKEKKETIDSPVKDADEDLIILGYSLSEKFGVKVVVDNSWNGGKITFHYSNLEELDEILMRLN